MAARRNLLYPTLVICIGIILLLLAVDLLPPAVGDLLQRSWPTLLIMAGLDMLLGERLRFGNWAALGVTVAGLGVVIYLAYTARVDEQRTEYREEIAPIELGEHIQGVRVKTEILNAAVIFQTTPDLARVIGARYLGSRATEVTMSLTEDSASGIVTLTITETQAEALPRLSDVGRGTLVVTLPVGIPIVEFDFQIERSAATLDFRALQVPRFTLTSQVSDVELYLPVQGSVPEGNVTVQDGNLLIEVNPSITLRVSGAPRDERFVEVNQNDYIVTMGGIIESRRAAGQQGYDMALAVDLPNGTLTIRGPGE